MIAVRPLTAVTVLLVALSAPVHADVTIVDDDFQSYTSTSNLYGTWVPAPSGSTEGLLIDETYEDFIDINDLEPTPIGARAFPDGGQGVYHVGGSVLEYAVSYEGSPLMPTESQHIVVEGDFFDLGAFGNKRMSIGLRSNAPENLIEMGQYNLGVNADGDAEFAYRAILFPATPENPNPNWDYFELPLSLDDPEDDDELTTVSDIGEAWYTYRATIAPESILFEIDVFRDGLVDASVEVPVTTGLNGYDSLRIGAPSGVPSAGGGAVFDNISLSLIDVETPLVGDYNGDGEVDAADYVVYRNTLGDSVAAGTGADGNGDGFITPLDLDVWKANYGSSPAPAAAAVPEPGSLLLVAAGLLAAARRR